MEINISFKDSSDVKTLKIQKFWFDYNALNIVLSDGTLKVYPDRHIFYVEVPQYYK